MVSSHIFTQWKWLIPFCPDDFLGQYKRRWKRVNLSLPHLLAAEHITMRRAHLIYGPLCLRNQSFIIRLTLLDQRLTEELNWIFNSTSNINNFIPTLIQLLYSFSTIYNCFLLPATYSTKFPSFKLPLKHCWNLSIFSPSSFYFHSFNIIGGNLFCLPVIQYRVI